MMCQTKAEGGRRCPSASTQRARRMRTINRHLRAIRSELALHAPVSPQAQILLARESTLLAQKRAVDARYSPDLPEMVRLKSAPGDTLLLPTDSITRDVDWIYLNGQCLAMANAMSERMTGMVVIHTLGSYWLGDGDITSPTIRHAYALAEDGSAWDVRGDNDLQVLELEEGEELLTMTPSEAQERFSGVLPPQDYEIARVYADMVIEEFAQYL